MAWVGQCRVAFKVDVNNAVSKQKGRKSVKKAIRQFSRESGVPARTLEKWYWPNSSPKNGSTIKQPVENKRNGAIAPEAVQGKIPICKRCKKYPVRVLTRKNGKKVLISERGKLHGLCPSCIEKQTQIEKLDRMANQNNGILAVCPHCNKAFFINSDRVKKGERK